MGFLNGSTTPRCEQGRPGGGLSVKSPHSQHSTRWWGRVQRVLGALRSGAVAGEVKGTRSSHEYPTRMNGAVVPSAGGGGEIPRGMWHSEYSEDSEDNNNSD